MYHLICWIRVEHCFLLAVCTSGIRPADPESRNPARGAFDVAAACDHVVGGDDTLGLSLTKARLVAVIGEFGARERDLQGRVAQLEAERDEAVEKLARRQGMATAQRQQQLLERMEARRVAAEVLSPSGHEDPVPADVTTPASTSTSTSTISSPPESRTPVPAWRRIAASVSGYLSPFPRRAPQQIPHSAPAAAPTEPLGELTSAARKRAASEEEDTPRQEHTSKPEGTPRQIRTPSAFLCPSTKNRRQPTSLSAITELTERSTSAAMTSSNTPTRAPRSVRAVRSARTAAASSERTWSSLSQQSSSSALIKYQRMRAHERESEQLRDDDEIKDMTLHRRKRVKVSELTIIPHHRPDEPSSTFRFPDIDSDEEMEVDEDEPVRTNMFAMAETETQQQVTATPSAAQTSALPPFEALGTPSPQSQSTSFLPDFQSTPYVPQYQSALPLPQTDSTPVPQAESTVQPSAHPRGEAFLAWYNTPVVRPTDPEGAAVFDRMDAVLETSGIGRRDPNEVLPSAAEIEEGSRRFMVTVMEYMSKKSEADQLRVKQLFSHTS